MNTKQTEALKLALEALEIGHEYAVETTEHFHIEMAGYKQQRHDAMDAEVKQIADAIAAIREALAEQPAQQQEPYGWKVYGVNSLFMGEFAEADAKAEAKRIGGNCIAFPLYTSPPASKPWVGLTDEERDAILNREFKQWWSRHDVVCRAIEAKLREKNA